VIDNLFIVESPLQALVAVELSLQFEGQTNGIIYRLSGKGRERNDEQICRVVELGSWSFREAINFGDTKRIIWHVNARKHISVLEKRFGGDVDTIFFGEFRSQWMQLARLAIAPRKHVLMDDGAATVLAKTMYLDKGVYFPSEFVGIKFGIKRALKNVIYSRFYDIRQSQKVVELASAFFKVDSRYPLDFSFIKQKVGSISLSEAPRSEAPTAFFFGSKYSEIGIVSQEYEIYFISKVLDYYRSLGLRSIYCAHRDESEFKLSLIKNLGHVDVVVPDLPAEIFLLERSVSVAEIGAAYSSVINNLAILFPEKPILSFRLRNDEVNPTYRSKVESVYGFYKASGISVKDI